jgi:hypothetical protein
LNSTGRETLERPTRFIWVVIILDVQPAVDGGASTTPDHVEAFPNEVFKVSVAASGSRLAIHGNLVFAFTVLAALPLSIRGSHFKGVGGLGDERSRGDNAALGTEAARGLV